MVSHASGSRAHHQPSFHVTEDSSESAHWPIVTPPDKSMKSSSRTELLGHRRALILLVWGGLSAGKPMRRTTRTRWAASVSWVQALSGEGAAGARKCWQCQRWVARVPRAGVPLTARTTSDRRSTFHRILREQKGAQADTSPTHSLLAPSPSPSAHRASRCRLNRPRLHRPGKRHPGRHPSSA